MQIDNLPLVTVIIPTINRLPLLKVALKSVYAQTYKNLEVIVIDVGSNDGTPEFLSTESEEKGIHFYRSEVPLKAGQARNIGIKKATGSIIAFLDDDDEWMPEKLEKQVKLFNDPEVGLVYTGLRFKYTDHDITYESDPVIEGYIFDEMLIENRIGGTCNMALRAGIAKELLFDERFPAREEYDLWLRIAKNYKIAGVHEPLIQVYARNTVARISSDVNNYVIAINLINDKYKQEIAALPAAKQTQRKAAQLFFLASQAVKANNLSLARSYYLKSLKAKFSVKAAGSFAASFFGIKALLLMRKLKG